MQVDAATLYCASARCYNIAPLGEARAVQRDRLGRKQGEQGTCVKLQNEFGQHVHLTEIDRYPL